MEERESKPIKQKLISVFDGTIIALALSAILVSFSFAYNGGFNYYFGIPQMFTNASWGGIIYRMPQVSQILIIASTIIVLFIFVRKWIVYANEKRKKEFNADKILLLVIICMILLLAGSIYFTIKVRSVIVLFTSILLLADVIYIIVFALKQRKFTKILADTLNKKPAETNDQELIDDIKKLTSSLDEKTSFSQVIPSFKPYWIANAFAIYSLLFVLCFVWGGKSAEKQSTFYFIDDETVITSISGNNVIAMSVSFDDNSKTYCNTGEYEIIPQEGLNFNIVNCGPIVSSVKQDEIKISIYFD